jgi:hypothetical protein
MVNGSKADSRLQSKNDLWHYEPIDAVFFHGVANKSGVRFYLVSVVSHGKSNNVNYHETLPTLQNFL